mgnify:CR=1 FL=1
MIIHLFKQEARIFARTRTGPPDEFGTPTWEETETDVWCHVQPAQSTEHQGPATGEVTWVGWFPTGTELAAADKIVMADGRELELVGPPRPWTNPRTGFVHHVVADLVEAS